MSKNAPARAWGRALPCAALASSALILAACGGGNAEDGTKTAAAAAITGIATAQAASDSKAWHTCVPEGSTCTFSGTRLIRYGADGSYTYLSATNGIACTNEAFGTDPAPGKAKSCWISSTPSPYKQDATQYTLTFRDDFSTGSLDTAKWNDHIWFEQSARTEDYGVSNGMLRIWPQADANGEFKSRILTTQNKFSQAYGYFEMEASLPVGRGVWPAFWLLNSDDPPNGEPELDIMEAYPGGATGYWGDDNQHPIAYQASVWQKGNGGDIADKGVTSQHDVHTGDLSAGFHKYALKWEPGRVSYYFDGELVNTVEVSMTRKMYLLVNMQYNCADCGQVDETTPLGPDNAFRINYVRAWQLKP
jgi:beta-glucanase (GH16 family)